MMNEQKTAKALIAALKEATRPPIHVAAEFADLTDAVEREAAFHALIEMLHDPDPWYRVRAVSALGYLGDRSAIEPIIQTMDDDDELAGGNMIEARFDVLSGFKDPRAIQPLIEHLHRVDFKQAWDLYAFGDDAVEPMIGALQHRDAYTRWQAAYWLGNRRNPRAVQALIESVRDEDKRVRGQAIASLGWIGSPEAVEFLKTLLKDADPHIHDAAVSAIERVADKH
jgi:HEAT repeat protein